MTLTFGSKEKGFVNSLLEALQQTYGYAILYSEAESLIANCPKHLHETCVNSHERLKRLLIEQVQFFCFVKK